MPSARPTPGDTRWFVRDRLGLFIHWGIYSLAARHEWIKQCEEIPDNVYDRYLDYFEPDRYDPDEWASMASDAGMKYLVVTTKHHDGFCLWDSKLTDYKVTNTPCGRDLIGPMVEAFRARDIRVGFYYSLLDWRFPGYFEPGKHRDSAEAMVQQFHAQVRELMTNYGKIDVLWYDLSLIHI